MLSEIMNDPHLHFATDGRGRRRVLLDGAEVDRVLAARVSSNMISGWVEVVSCDSEGKIALDGEEVATRIIEGDVRVEFVDA